MTGSIRSPYGKLDFSARSPKEQRAFLESFANVVERVAKVDHAARTSKSNARAAKAVQDEPRAVPRGATMRVFVIYLDDAKAQGLISRTPQRSVVLTPAGRTYAVEHRLIRG